MSSRPRVLTTVDPRTDERWAALTERFSYASLFHAPAWLRAVSKTYDLVPEATILCDGNALTAGMLHTRIDDPRGLRVVTNPFSDFCDPLAETEADWNEIATTVLRDPASFSMRIRKSPWPLNDGRLTSEAIGFWHSVELAEDDEVQWAQLKGSARRNIRHAREAGADVTVCADSKDLREFYELHRQLRKEKYALLAQPWEFFERLLEEFGPTGDLHVLLARVDGHAIAGILALAWGDTLYYKFNASAIDELDVRPNDLLAWEALNLARREGLKRLDFGFSDADQPGLIRYKRKFATDESMVHRLNRRGTPAPASAAAFGRSLEELTRLLTDDRIPLDINESASSLLYRYFA